MNREGMREEEENRKGKARISERYRSFLSIRTISYIIMN